MFQRFDTIPARGHAHIHEGHGVRVVLLDGLLHESQCFLALIRGIQAECGALNPSVVPAKQRFLDVFKVPSRFGVGAEDLIEITMDRRVIIHDQQPRTSRILGSIIHFQFVLPEPAQDNKTRLPLKWLPCTIEVPSVQLFPCLVKARFVPGLGLWMEKGWKKSNRGGSAAPGASTANEASS